MIALLPFLGALANILRLVIFHLLLPAPMTVFIGEFDKRFLRLIDPNKLGAKIMAVCRITLFTIPTAIGELLEIDTTSFRSPICHHCHAYDFSGSSFYLPCWYWQTTYPGAP